MNFKGFGKFGRGAGLALLLMTAPAFAAEPQQAAKPQAQDALLDRKLKLSIAAQGVASAIVELSKLAGVQLIIGGSTLDGFTTPGISGEMSLRAALNALLEGTGHRFHKLGNNTIGIDPPAQTSTADANAETVSGPAGAVVADAAVPAAIAVTSITNESDNSTASTADERPGAQRLDDIIVTATKREKSARDIPVSISAVRGEDLEKMGARDIKDYMMQVPGLALDEDNKGEAGGRRLTIRGIGPSAVDGNQTVGQFIGDIPMTDPVGNRMTPDVDPFDLKTVEVLKGPQGTTFGATALNGAIRYVPNAPELEQWQARGFADVSKVKYGGLSKSYGAAVNVPVGETLALRGVGVLQDASGLYDNGRRGETDADSRQKWSARGLAHWAPWEALGVDLMFIKQRSVSDDLLVADNDETFANSFKPGPSSLVSEFSLADIDARYNMGDWGTLVWQSSSQTKFVEADVDASLRAIGMYGIESIRGFTRTEVEGRTHELRWVSTEGERWSWIVGGFIQDYDLNYDSATYVGAPQQLDPVLQLLGIVLNGPLSPETITPRGITLFGNSLTPLSATEHSIYGELSRRLGKHWELTVGGRRYETRIEATASRTGLGTASGLVDNGGKLTDHVMQSEKGFSPKASLAWKPSESLMIYALLARGFQFGGVNGPALLKFPNPVTGTHPLEYHSSRLWNREIGVRTDWLDRTLRLDATVYDIDWGDAQIRQYSEGTIFQIGYVGNIGSVRSQGVEATLNWLTPLTGLSVNLAAAYNQARTAADTENNGNVTPAGATLPAAPPVQVSSGVAYSTYFGPWVSNAGLSYAYWSKTYNNLQHDFELYDFGSMGLNLSTARPDWTGSPTLSLGVQNLLDERGLIGRFGASTAQVASSVSNAGVGQGWTYIRPRTISLRLTAQFD